MKLTLGTAYRAVEKTIPKSALFKLKKTSLYRTGSDLARKHLKRDNIPSWQVISGGPLKGVMLYVDPSGDWQQEMLSGNYDPFFINFVDKLDLKGKTVFDIGAHIGLHSLYFAERVGHAGHVVAFEPNPANVERIKMHTEKNRNIGLRISIVNKAVSNVSGMIDFVFSDFVDDGSSMGGFVDTADTFFEKGSYEEIRGFKRAVVETTTLDRIVQSNAYLAPALLKIDVEGAEYLVLEGGTGLLEKYRPTLLIEIHSVLNMKNVSKILAKYNYAFEVLKEDRKSRCFIAASPK